MKVLLVLEHHFFKDSTGTVWCDRVVDYHFFERYLQSFERVLVCARVENVGENVNHCWNVASGKGVTFVGLPNFYGAFDTLKNYIKLKKIVKRAIECVDCCIIRIPSPISLVTFGTIYSSGKPVAAEMMMSARRMFDSQSFPYGIINGILHLYTKYICFRVDGVSYVTNHILQGEYPTNGFSENYSSINLRECDYYIPSWNKKARLEEFIIINTGFMDDYRKGQHIVIKTIVELVRQGYNVKCILAGDGIKRKEFEELAKAENVDDRVTFTGLLDKEQIAYYLKSSHILMLPTQSEGLPRSIIEAMAVGLPCVASDVDGIPELLDEKYLVHDFEVMHYVEKIKIFLDDFEEMKKASAMNYNKALQYSKANLDKKRKAFYDKLVEKCNYVR